MSISPPHGESAEDGAGDHSARDGVDGVAEQAPFNVHQAQLDALEAYNQAWEEKKAADRAAADERESFAQEQADILRECEEKFAAQLRAREAKSSAALKERLDAQLADAARAVTITAGEAAAAADLNREVSQFAAALREFKSDKFLHYGRLPVPQSAIPMNPQSGLPALEERRQVRTGEAAGAAGELAAACDKFLGLATEIAELNQRIPMYEVKMLAGTHARAMDKARAEDAAAKRAADAASKEAMAASIAAALSSASQEGAGAGSGSGALKRKGDELMASISKRQRLL